MAIIFYRLTANMEYLSARCNNVFHYRSNDADTPDAQELVTLFNVEWTNALKDILNVLCLIKNYYAVRVDDLGDYGDFNVGQFGNVGTSASALPPQWASCFTGITSGSAIRHSFKRFTGVDESMITGSNLATPFVAPMNVICAKMATVLNGSSATYEPVSARYNNASPPTITGAALINTANFKRFNTQRSRIT